MAWKIEYSRTATEQLQRLDKPAARSLLDYGDELARRDEPRNSGQALPGSMGIFWRFQVGDGSLICDIQDNGARIVVLRLGKRQEQDDGNR